MPCFKEPDCSQVDCGVEPCFERRRDSQVDCLQSQINNLDSGQLDCDTNLHLSSSGELDSDKLAGESRGWDLEKTLDNSFECLETNQQHGDICSENILRQINGCPGIYVSGSIQGVKVQWTTDTGATRSIISKQVFEKIPKESRPELEKSN